MIDSDKNFDLFVDFIIWETIYADITLLRCINIYKQQEWKIEFLKKF
jgi:hypothetical protein